MVLSHGNAPRSIGYRPTALLLSYTRNSLREFLKKSAKRISPRFAVLLSEKWRRREVMLPSGNAAQSASNGCRRLGRFRLRKSPRQEFAPRIPNTESAQRILKWSLHEDLHLDLELRGLSSCLLDDEGKNGARPNPAPAATRLCGPSTAW